MTKRTFEDWENASVRINHVSNDFFTISGLRNEFIYLGYLDEMINEMCDESLKGSTKLNMRPRITMLSRLWMLHAYEVVRSLDEFDRNRHEDSGGKMANFKTGRFEALKKDLEKIRIPMVKQEIAGTSKKGSGSSYFEIKKGGTKNISFVSNGEEIFREEMARQVLDIVNNYDRNNII